MTHQIRKLLGRIRHRNFLHNCLGSHRTNRPGSFLHHIRHSNRAQGLPALGLAVPVSVPGSGLVLGLAVPVSVPALARPAGSAPVFRHRRLVE